MVVVVTDETVAREDRGGGRWLTKRKREKSENTIAGLRERKRKRKKGRRK